MSEGSLTEIYFYHLGAARRAGAADLARTVAARLARRRASGERRARRSSEHAAVDLSRGKLPAARHRAMDTLRASHLSHDQRRQPQRGAGALSGRWRTLADARLIPASPCIRRARRGSGFARARGWQAAKARGDAVSYWRQDADGRWERKAKRGYRIIDPSQSRRLPEGFFLQFKYSTFLPFAL